MEKEIYNYKKQDTYELKEILENYPIIVNYDFIELTQKNKTQEKQKKFFLSEIKKIKQITKTKLQILTTNNQIIKTWK